VAPGLDRGVVPGLRGHPVTLRQLGVLQHGLGGRLFDRGGGWLRKRAQSAESTPRIGGSGIGFAVLPEHMVSGDKVLDTRTSPLPAGRGRPSAWRWELVWPKHELTAHGRHWGESVRSASAAPIACPTTRITVSGRAGHVGASSEARGGCGAVETEERCRVHG